MRPLRNPRLPEIFRSGGIFAVLFALVLLLASCSSGSGVVGGPDLPAQPAGKSVPPVAIQQITGVPPGKVADLKAALARAAGERDIGIVEGDFQNGSFTLSGSFRAQSDSSGVHVVYQWQLRDTEGVLVHTFDGDENAGLFSGKDAWGAVTPAVFDRVARASAESIAVRLSQLGYATRVTALWVPPAEYFAMAGPGAEREVDMETLDGPNTALAMDGLGPEEDVTYDEAANTPAETKVADAAEPANNQSAQPIPAPNDGKTETAKAADDGATAISAVAVLPVQGSPGGGNAELTSAMRRTLAAAGWPVVSRPQANAITIIGSVDVSKPSGDQQNVRVRWVVKMPGGSQLGDIKQANLVPAGTLDAGWGDAAIVVAEGAATGIFDLVKRYR